METTTATRSEPKTTNSPLSLTSWSLYVINFIASLDATALSVSIPTIAAALNASSIQAYWTGTAFVLSSAVFQPVFATLGNAFGRKPMVLTALIIFMVGTVVCGTAQNIAALLAGRAVQGIGGGGLLTLTYMVIADLYPLRKRGSFFAYISLVWIFGTSCGPILGGVFTTYVTWRWIFWICLPLAGIGIALVSLFLHTPHEALHPGKALKTIDWIGAAIFVISLTGFLVAISWGGSMFPWGSYKTLVPLIVGACGVVAWLFFEHRVPASPMLPVFLLKNRYAAAAFFLTFLMGMVQFGLLYYLPLYYEVSKGYSPIISGVALLPNCMGSGFIALATGKYIKRSGRYKILMCIGWALLAIGCGLLVLLNTRTSIPAWVFINLVTGFGLGCLFTTLSMAVQAPQHKTYQGHASALSPFFRAVGQAFGIAIGDAVYQNALRHHLRNTSSQLLQQQASRFAKDSARLVVILREMKGVHRSELLAAFNNSLHALWYLLMGIASAGLCVSLLLREYTLDEAKPGAAEAGSEDLEQGDKASEGDEDGVELSDR